MCTRSSKRKIKLSMTVDLGDNFSEKSALSEDNSQSSVVSNNSIALNVINELNDLIIAKRDLIIESFATKRGPIGRHQIKDYLNQMTEVVINKRNEILGSCASTATPLSLRDCNGSNVTSKDCHLNSTLDVTEISEKKSLDKVSGKATKSKTKTKSKNVKKSTKRGKSVGRKGIGKLLFDYRNRNPIPDYQKRLKYVEKDPTIDILHKRIGLVATRLSAIPESDELF